MMPEEEKKNALAMPEGLFENLIFLILLKQLKRFFKTEKKCLFQFWNVQMHSQSFFGA